MQAIKEQPNADGFGHLRTRAYAIIEADFSGVSASAARNADIAESTFAAWMKGNYKGDIDNIAALVTKWLDSRAEQAEVVRASMASIGYLDTPTAKSVEMICTQAQALCDFAVISGVAGVGKTTALRHYRDKSSHVYMLTAAPLMKSPLDVLRKLGRVVGVSERASGGLSDALIEQLKGRQALVILDEAHHLTPDAFDQMRSLHDNAEVGLVACGNVEVASLLEGAGRNPQFAPLWSRVGIRAKWTEPKKGDVDLILDAWQIEDLKSRKYLATIAGKGGALRSITKTMRLAGMLAQGNGADRVELGHIKAAYGQLADGGAHG